jgi:hypothetical protein
MIPEANEIQRQVMVSDPRSTGMHGCIWSPASSPQKIDVRVYALYYRAVGPYLAWAVLLAVVGMQATRNATDLWLAHWVSSSQVYGQSNVSEAARNAMQLLLGYAFAVFCS